MKSLLKWWLIFSLTLLGLGTCVYFNIHKDLYAADVRMIYNDAQMLNGSFEGDTISQIGKKHQKKEKEETR